MEIFAHRGASGSFPENTLAAFRETARLPVHGVEFDVHMTKDGQLVVIHDESIDRTSNGKGFVKDQTLAELKEYDFGSWFSPSFRDERIPTLDEVFQVFHDTHHVLNIELKSDIFPYEGMVKKVLDAIQQFDLEERIILSSFDHSAIQKAKQLAPTIETGALTMEVLIHPLAYLRIIPADSYHVLFPTALRPTFQEVFLADIPVRAYTVNEEAYAAQLQQAGVQAIFTDYPERMHTYLNK